MRKGEPFLLHLGRNAGPLTALQLTIFDDSEEENLVSFSVPLTGTGSARHDE